MSQVFRFPTARTVALFLAAALVAALVTIPASPADAAYASTLSGDRNIFQCAQDLSVCKQKVKGGALAKSGSAVNMICWEDGRYAYSKPHPRWFYVQVKGFGEGFVKAEFVKNQTKVPNCEDKKASTRVRGVNAATWALKKIGKVSPTSSDNKRLNSTWGLSLNFMLGDWSGDCVSYTALAWLDAGLKMRHANARDLYYAYKKADKLKTSSAIPRGALVFWPNVAPPYGHVAISLGNGQVATTLGLDGDRKANAIKSKNYFGTPSGWAWPMK